MPDPSEFRTDSFVAARYHELQMKASHNSYAKSVLLDTQLRRNEGAPHAFGCRAVELDLHECDGPFPWSVKHFRHQADQDFGEFLAQLLRWSDDRPEHDPIAVSIDLKEPGPVDRFVDALDGYLRAEGFGEERLVTPAEVRATGAVVWPALPEMRGRFVLVLSGSEDHKSAYAGAADRLCFADRKAGPASYAAKLRDGDPRVFFNFDMGHWRASTTGPALPSGYLSRVYGIWDETDWNRARELGFNLLATDRLRARWAVLPSKLPFSPRPT